MSSGANTFPLNIVARQDASFAGTLKGIETTVEGTFARIGAAGESALRRATKFDFSAARRDLDGLKQSMDGLGAQRATANADLFGIKASIAALKASPFQQVINEQAAASSMLAAQRAAAIQKELDAGLASIRERSAAQTAAFAKAEQEGLSLVALEKQRAAAAAALVAAPTSSAPAYFDPSGAQTAATAARTYAANLAEVAAASERVVATGQSVTATDRAQAVALREAAEAADLDANRLEALAATQAKVAAVAGEAGGKFAANQNLVARSSNASRIASLQAGQQLQDFAIQVQGGVNPLIALSQQGSQLAFVLSGVGGTAGKVASFFAGTWGAGIIIATTVLGPLIANMLGFGEASDAAEASAKKFADRQGDIKNFVDQATGSLVEQNKTLVLNAVLTRQAQIAKNNAEAADSRRAAFKTASAAAAAGIFSNRKPTATTGFLGQQQNIFGPAGDPDIQAAIRSSAGDVDKLTQSIVNLARTKRPDLAGFAVQISTQAGAAVLAARDNKKLNDELAALGGKQTGNFSNPGAVSGLIAIAAATTPAAKRLAELNQQLHDFEAAASAGRFKGTRDQYVAQAAALKRQIEAQEKVVAAARRAAPSRTGILNAQASVAAADDPVEKARAELALTKATSAELLKQGKIGESAYRSRVQAAQVSLNAAEGDKRAAAMGEKAARAYKQLTEFGERARDAIANISGEFDDQPRLIDRAAAATRKLDEMIIDLEQRKPPGFKELIATAERAKEVVENGINKPYRDLISQQREQLQIGQLVNQGLGDEADALAIILNLEKTKGAVQASERLQILDNVRALKDQEAQHQRNLDLINIQVRAAQDIQAALTDALTAPFKKGSIKQFTDALTGIRQRRIAAELSVKLLGGDLGRQIGDELTRRGGQFGNELATAASRAAQPIGASGKSFETAADRFATAVDKFAGGVGSASSGTIPTGSGSSLPNAVRAASTANDNDSGDIVVNAKRLVQDAITDGPGKLKVDLSGSGIDLSRLRGLPNDRLSDALSKFETPLSYLAGAVGGRGAALINSGLNVREYRKLGDEIGTAISKSKLGAAIGERAGNAVAGLGQGQAADSLVKALGLKGSATGGAIGGGIGGAVAGPLGAYIGGTLGSLIGGAFKKAQTGSATITSVGGGASLTGSSASYRAAAGEQASAVQDSLSKIISALGATAGSFAVSIGQRDGKYVVDTNGTGSTKYGKANDGITAYKTEAEAQRAALLNAIQDGAVAGIREGAQRLLRAGTDLDRQLQKALDFQSVFTQLKEYTDPVGAAIDALDKQFDYLRSVFAEASASSAEYADLEKLYGIKRTEAIKNAAQDATSTLQSLLDDLNFRGDSGLSLRTREANARATFDPLAATIKAGGKVDQSAFADAAKAYLDIERQLYGSTSKYFDALSFTSGLTSQAIRNAGGTVTGASSNDNAATVQSANDNAAQLAQALYAQTQALQIPANAAARFTSGDFSAAVAAGLTGAASLGAAAAASLSPSATPSTEPVVTAIDHQTAILGEQLRSGFDLLIRATAANGKNGSPATASGWIPGAASYTLRNA